MAGTAAIRQLGAALTCGLRGCTVTEKGNMHMRKRTMTATHPDSPLPDDGWLDLEHLAEVEITSEDTAHPVESALLPGRNSGWRAAASGEQTIRLVFDDPQRLKRIRLVFVEPDVERTQEFVLRWSADGGQTFREIVRQQWNFSRSSAEEVEDLRVDLSEVGMLELTIIPDISLGDARASLAQFRIA